jgi:predicted component of type VI protein secretion system
MTLPETYPYDRALSNSIIGLYYVRTHKVYELDPSKEKYWIGRSLACEIQLTDPTVSSVHCEIRRASDGALTIEDAESRNGLWINHVRTSHALLIPGMWIYLGASELVTIGPDRMIAITARSNVSFLAKAAIYYASSYEAAAHTGKSSSTILRALKRFREETE